MPIPMRSKRILRKSCKNTGITNTGKDFSKRYMNNKPTILSGEYLPSTLIKIDEAFGSRVVEMCKPDYLISLTGTGKNQRLSNI